MSRKLLLLAASVAFLSGAATFAQAADVLEPQVVDLPEPAMPVAAPTHGGWYLRGDIGYSMNKMSDVEYDVFGGAPGSFSTGLLLTDKLRSGYSLGAGVGYDTGNYLRFDLTADYFAKTNFNGNTYCNDPAVAGDPDVICSDDSSSLTALSLMANAYIDLGKYNGFTPYVGAGIGGTHVKWGTENNVCTAAGLANGVCTTDTHPGAANWRFTYAAMAGVSYDVTDCVAVEAGYRYRKIEGGKMFGISSGGLAPAGYDKGISSHDFRVGARFKLAGLSGGCGASHVPDYQPDYQPVYK